LKDKLLVPLLIIVVLLQLGLFYKSLGSKIGSVNMDTILLQSPDAKKAQAELDEAKAKYEELVQQRQEELNREQSSVRTQAGLNQLKQKMEMYKKELAGKQEELVKLNDKLNSKIRTKIVGFLSKIARKKGVRYVYDEKSIYLSDIDLTQDLLKTLKANEPVDIPIVITENITTTENNTITKNIK